MMRSAPSHSFAPSRSIAPSHSLGPSHSISPSRSISPGIGSTNHSPAANRVHPSISGTGNGVNGTHSALRVPTSGANALSGVARHNTSWNNASHSQLKHVHANLNHAVNPTNTARHNIQPSNLHTSSLANNHHHNAFANQGNAIRNNWNHNGNHNCFHRNWWIGRSFYGFGGFGWYGGWGYSPWANYYPWWYWWNRPSWNSCVSYFPGYGWNNGYYYNYGPGGNVVYDNGQVVVDGEAVATDAEYAQSAAELATVDPADLKAVQPGDWMALGTFSMAVKDDEVDPARVMQLAVSKTGLVSGTIYNRTSGNTYTVQGRVDKETQRLAFTIGEDHSTVLETGIYNLTQDQTPVLCHFGTSQHQTYLLARLPEPEHETAPAATPALPGREPADQAPAVPAPAPAPDAKSAAATTPVETPATVAATSVESAAEQTVAAPAAVGPPTVVGPNER